MPRRIYRLGFGYHKTGVILLDLVPAANRQFALFDTQGDIGDVRSAKLMGVLDDIKQRYGRGMIRLAADSVVRCWQMGRGKHHVNEEQNKMFSKAKAKATSLYLIELGARMAGTICGQATAQAQRQSVPR